MGILKEMFDEENSEEFAKRPEELLAKGRYKSSAELILSGYKTFQMKYVLKNLVLKMLLVLLALASSVMMLLTSDNGSTTPVLLIMVCICIGVYFISEPINNRKKLKSGLSQTEGDEYEIEITDQKVKISAVIDENSEIKQTEEEKTEIKEENTEETEEIPEEDQGPPATIIHLDSHIVDLIDKEDMFIICVKKSYVFIIPKSAFNEEDVRKTREKLSAIMGVRFKIID